MFSRNKDKGQKNKKLAKEKSGLVEQAPAPVSHAFKKNFESQATSLGFALEAQKETTAARSEELRDLNNRFDVEVSTRRREEEAVAVLQNKLAILQSKVKGLELQFENEESRDKNLPFQKKKALPDMMTIRKIHSHTVTSNAPRCRELPQLRSPVPRRGRNMSQSVRLAKPPTRKPCGLSESQKIKTPNFPPPPMLKTSNTKSGVIIPPPMRPKPPPSL